jgi:hypothetical protein
MRLVKLIEDKPKPSIFLVSFFYVLLLGIFVQFVFLPSSFGRRFYSDHGLLGGYDGLKFHYIAVESANEIRNVGWQAWEILPENQIVSGIASVLYTLFLPEPWVMLPINALFQGAASVLLFSILHKLIKNTRTAFISVLPFIFFPSNLLWNTQMHNEVFVMPSLYLFLWGWISLSEIPPSIHWKKIVLSTFAIFLGSLGLWLIRDYIMSIIFILSIVVALLVFIWNTVICIKNQQPFQSYLLSYLSIVAALYLSSPFFLSNIIQPSKKYSLANSINSMYQSSDSYKQNNSSLEWTRTSILPRQIDSLFYKFGGLRGKLVDKWSGAGSEIDTQTDFHSAVDVIKYLPRAIEIAFLAPFPSDWFRSGQKSAGNLMIRINAIEMFLIYTSLIGLVGSSIRLKKSMTFYILCIFCVSLMIIYAYAIPNVGALVRFRYGYYLPFIGLGVGWWVENKGRRVADS